MGQTEAVTQKTHNLNPMIPVQGVKSCLKFKELHYKLIMSLQEVKNTEQRDKNNKGDTLEDIYQPPDYGKLEASQTQ